MRKEEVEEVEEYDEKGMVRDGEVTVGGSTHQMREEG